MTRIEVTQHHIEDAQHGDRVQVRSFLRGYAAALDHPAIRHITNMVNDEDSTTTDILEAAIDVANIAPGGRS